MKKIGIKKILKLLKWIIVGYLVFIIIVSTVPYINQKSVSQESISKLYNVGDYTKKNDSDDRITLVEMPNESFSARIDLINEAKETLDISYHVIHFGKSTEAFFGALLNAADRGVEIRFLIDATVNISNPEMQKIYKTIGNHENITLYRYNPIKPFSPWKWHALLHDKYIIVDNEYLLTGGRNIGDKYFDPSDFDKSVTYDRDVLVHNKNDSDDSIIHSVREYMENMIALDCTEIYTKTLSNKKEKDVYDRLIEREKTYIDDQPELYQYDLDYFLDKGVKTNKITLISNPINPGPKEPWLGYEMVELAKTAKNKVTIHTPYATGNKKLIQSITDVSSNIENLEFITNSMGTTPNFPAFSTYSANRKKFLKAGAAIYELQTPFSLHTKSMLVDENISVIGTFNLDDRSFYINTEMMFVIDSEDFNSILQEKADEYKSTSLRVGDDNKYIKDENVQELPVKASKKVIMKIVSFFTRIFQFLI